MIISRSSHHLTPLSSSFLTLSSPLISRHLIAQPPQLIPIKTLTFRIRSSSSSITSKPSSELRKKRNENKELDEKLGALRELFKKPGIGIDAYIIPSQDAHQVKLHILLNFVKRSNRFMWIYNFSDYFTVYYTLRPKLNVSWRSS